MKDNKNESIFSEEKRQYLAFLQETINRMAHNSASLKQWLIPILALCFGTELSSTNKMPGIAELSLIIIFWFLDAYYLMLEKSFRKTFNEAVEDKTKLYDMRPAQSERGFIKWLSSMKTMATWPFYLGLLILTIILIYCI